MEHFEYDDEFNDDYGDREGESLRLFMITVINAHHEEILNILESEELGGQSFMLSTSNIIFESFLTAKEISTVLREYSMLGGYNFMLIDITESTNTSMMNFHMNPKANPKIGDLMQFVLSFFDREDVMSNIEGKNKPSQDNVDRILEKINRRGIDSLSPKEQALLKRFKKEN